MLDHVEVAPADMVGDDDSRFADRELVARDDDRRAVEPLEDELDAGPAGPGDGAGEPVGQQGVEGPQQQEEREQQVLDQQCQGPGGDDGYAAEVGEDAAESACHLGARSAGLDRGFRGRKRRRRDAAPDRMSWRTRDVWPDALCV